MTALICSAISDSRRDFSTDAQSQRLGVTGPGQTFPTDAQESALGVPVLLSLSQGLDFRTMTAAVGMG